jgi:hypothetical protein
MSAQQYTLRAAVRFLFITLLMLAGYVLLHLIAAAPFLVAGL